MTRNDKEIGGDLTSAERAALHLAAGPDGSVDPLAFHAQRLILTHETTDGVDAKSLAASLSAFAQADLPHDAIKEAVLARLDAANGDKLKREFVRQHQTSGGSAARPSRLHSLRALFRPRSTLQTRWPESKELAHFMTQKRVRQARAETAKAVLALEQYVSRTLFLEEFVGNADFRKLIIGLAQIYSKIDESMADPTRVKPDGLIRYVAAIALIHWRGNLATAVAEGREEQYLTELGDVGMDAMLCSVPMDDFWKFGGMERSYFKNGIDLADPAVAAALSDADEASQRSR
jgi:hypothetical protein